MGSVPPVGYSTVVSARDIRRNGAYDDWRCWTSWSCARTCSRRPALVPASTGNRASTSHGRISCGGGPASGRARSASRVHEEVSNRRSSLRSQRARANSWTCADQQQGDRSSITVSGAAAGFLPSASRPCAARYFFQSRSRRLKSASEMTLLFCSAKSADLIETPAMSPRDTAPHFGHLVSGACIPRDCRRRVRSSVTRWQMSSSSSHVVEGDHAAVRTSIISGNQTRCASPEGTRHLLDQAVRPAQPTTSSPPPDQVLMRPLG